MGVSGRGLGRDVKTNDLIMYIFFNFLFMKRIVIEWYLNHP